MNRVTAYLASLRQPVRLIQLLMVIGGLWIVFVLLSATNAPPKPWEDQGPEYLAGAMEPFERTFPSQPLPATALSSEEGEVTLAQLAGGRPLVVNLWATWCAPCLEELPSLSALQDNLGERARVVAVAMEPGDGARQRQMLDRLGADAVTLAWDPKLKLMQAYGGNLQLPLTVIYDGRGREIGRLLGAADWSAPEAERLVSAVAAGNYPG